MAATLQYFMLPEDEVALFRHLARRELTAYPELIPPGYVPIPVDERAPARLDADAGRGAMLDASGVGELLILATRIAKSYESLVERV